MPVRGGGDIIPWHHWYKCFIFKLLLTIKLYSEDSECGVMGTVCLCSRHEACLVSCCFPCFALPTSICYRLFTLSQVSVSVQGAGIKPLPPDWPISQSSVPPPAPSHSPACNQLIKPRYLSQVFAVIHCQITVSLFALWLTFSDWLLT